jgi:hypothetical protein
MALTRSVRSRSGWPEPLPEDRRRWTLACRDDAGRVRVHNIEVTEHGVVRLLPPMVGPTVWDPEQIDSLVVALIEARGLAVRRRAGDVERG